MGAAGGGSGIGRATCLQLAKEGACLVVTSRTLEAARETLSLLPGKLPPSISCPVKYHSLLDY